MIRLSSLLSKKHPPTTRTSYDGPGGRPVYEHDFQVTFKEASQLSRNVYFTHMIAWIGKMRELPMQHIAEELLEDFSSGQWGIVTNSTSLRVLGQASSYDTIRARAYLGDVEGSSFSGHFEFYKLLPGGDTEPLAVGEVRATWVRLVDYGVPLPEAFPAYLDDYLTTYGARREGECGQVPASGYADLDLGDLLYRKPLGVGRGRELWAESFHTTFEEACVVGNIYYGNYFIWQGRVRDLFLHSAAPQLLRTDAPQGEAACLHAHMDYLREAMPFDRIRVAMRLEALYECGATFLFEFYRDAGGRFEKLAVGRHEAAWLKRSRNGDTQAAPWPEPILQALTGAAQTSAA